MGEWVLVRFLAYETGRMRKRARPWHTRCYQSMDCGVGVPPAGWIIAVHATQITPCPDEFPAGYYWYGEWVTVRKNVTYWRLAPTPLGFAPCKNLNVRHSCFPHHCTREIGFRPPSRYTTTRQTHRS